MKRSKKPASEIRPRKRLFFDIETSPNIGYVWSAGREITFTTDAIRRERAVICIAWRWEGQKKIHHLTWDRNQNDKAMLRSFTKLLLESDEAIAHNGDRFDIRWLRTRCLKHQLPFPPKVVTIDTLKKCRSLFLFNSNRLDYVAEYLGVGRKLKHPGMEMWDKIVWEKSKTELARMVRYCKRDVELLQGIFNKISPYLPATTRLDRKVSTCPHCGSGNTTIGKARTSAAGVRKTQLQCKDCFGFHTVATSKLERER